MTQLPETAYAPFSEPWVLADIDRAGTHPASTRTASPSSASTTSASSPGSQHAAEAPCGPDTTQAESYPPPARTQDAAPAAALQEYWAQTKSAVLSRPVREYWVRIRGAVFPFVGGITGGVVCGALAVYTIKSA